MYENDSEKEARIVKLQSEPRESEQYARRNYAGAPAPTNVSLQLELKKRDEVKLRNMLLSMIFIVCFS